MLSLDKLIKLDDLLCGRYHLLPCELPTQNSIEYINNHFGIQLPQTLIKIALKSKSFGSYFSSLGEDYTNPVHIIRNNSRYKNLYRCKHGDKWRRAKPKEYIVINHGHDNDCICLDLGNTNSGTNEYEVIYWYPGIENIDVRYKSFDCYYEKHVMFHVNSHLNNKNRSGQLRSYSRNLAEKINMILESNSD
jgi:hypothetical protein